MANSTIALSQSELDVVRPIELSFALPRSYGTRIYLRLTIRAKFILLFLTTAQDGDSVAASLGSFVFALPDASYNFSSLFFISIFFCLVALDNLLGMSRY